MARWPAPPARRELLDVACGERDPVLRRDYFLDERDGLAVSVDDRNERVDAGGVDRVRRLIYGWTVARQDRLRWEQQQCREDSDEDGPAHRGSEHVRSPP